MIFYILKLLNIYIFFKINSKNNIPKVKLSLRLILVKFFITNNLISYL